MKIIQSILCVLGIIVIFFMIDLFCISDKRKPIVYFDDTYYDDGYYVYKGIIYDVYDCVGLNVINDTSVVFKWKDYECKKINQFDIQTVKITKIVDETKNDSNYRCDEKNEILFEDSINRYYFNCTKSEYIKVYYDDGNVDTLKKAVSKGYVTMSDLDKYQIEYVKEAK